VSQACRAGRNGSPAQATVLADEGATRFAPYAPWWNHLARRLVAREALDGKWGQPAQWMREAASDFDASGHQQLASACRGILRQSGEPVPRPGRGSARVPAQLRGLGVTSREMEVYRLVAWGCSNAEIAGKLCISPKTVETHVASLITRTGQTSRRELVAHTARFIAAMSGR
jgi:DNA-binding CsgD family transcriptional regulator